MIGLYVHHVGSGHLHRAGSLAAELRAAGQQVTGLSSLARPRDWPGDWVQLPRDDGGDVACPTARGRLHWVPAGHAGLRERMAAISAWLDRARPLAVVVDVSVEVALLVRLHGVRVVAVVLPGVRDDEAHRLGLDVADALVACWPPEARDMLRGVPVETKQRLHAVGAVSRFPVADEPPEPTPRTVAVLLGSGGAAVTADALERARARTPGWTWQVLGAGTWVDDPRPVLLGSAVVVTHAGQNALAEVAACRRPAVVLPQDRPHDEQRTTGEVLADGPWPALVREAWPEHGWAALLEEAAALDGRGWSGWCDGKGAHRAAEVVLDVARTGESDRR